MFMSWYVSERTEHLYSVSGITFTMSVSFSSFYLILLKLFYYKICCLFADFSKSHCNLEFEQFNNLNNCYLMLYSGLIINIKFTVLPSLSADLFNVQYHTLEVTIIRNFNKRHKSTLTYQLFFSNRQFSGTVAAWTTFLGHCSNCKICACTIYLCDVMHIMISCYSLYFLPFQTSYICKNIYFSWGVNLPEREL